MSANDEDVIRRLRAALRLAQDAGTDGEFDAAVEGAARMLKQNKRAVSQFSETSSVKIIDRTVEIENAVRDKHQALREVADLKYKLGERDRTIYSMQQQIKALKKSRGAEEVSLSQPTVIDVRVPQVAATPRAKPNRVTGNGLIVLRCVAASVDDPVSQLEIYAAYNAATDLKADAMAAETQGAFRHPCQARLSEMVTATKFGQVVLEKLLVKGMKYFRFTAFGRQIFEASMRDHEITIHRMSDDEHIELETLP